MSRPVTKFAVPSEQQLEQLAEVYNSHRLSSFRRRAHAILLSAQGFTPANIAKVLGADPDTVRLWIDHFNANGCKGLEDKPRIGSLPILIDKEQRLLRELIDIYPNQPRRVLAELKQKTGKTISRTTLRRYCRRFGLRWKRFRKSLKHNRDQEEFDAAQYKIAAWGADPTVEVAYFDESTLTLRGVVPYGWQQEGERTLVPVNGGSYPSLQTLGFELKDGSVRCYFHRGMVNSQVVVDVIDDFSKNINRPTIVILDNASVHTSGQVKAQIEKWKQRGLLLYFLPSYSPELNLIERFWKKLKYQFMPSDAWENFQIMLDCATAVIQQCGKAILMPSVECYAV